MTFVSCHRPFCRTDIAGCAAVARLLLTPAVDARARAQAAQAVATGRAHPTAPNPTAPNPTAPKPAASAAAPAVAAPAMRAAVDQANPPQPEEPHRQGDRQGQSRSRNRPATFSAACHACRRRAAPDRWARCRMSRASSPPGEPVVIIAFGSSSTQGYGSTSPEFTYPNRLAGAAAPAISDRRHHRHQSRPGRRRCARNDEAAADRSDRHEAGSGDLAGRHQRRAAQPRSRRDRASWWRTASARIQAAGADVVLVDPQYSPRVTEHRGKRQPDGAAARQGRRSFVMSASSRASR